MRLVYLTFCLNFVDVFKQGSKEVKKVFFICFLILCEKQLGNVFTSTENYYYWAPMWCKLCRKKLKWKVYVLLTYYNMYKDTMHGTPLQNLRTYASYVLARAYPSTLCNVCLALFNLARQLLQENHYSRIVGIIWKQELWMWIFRKNEL